MKYALKLLDRINKIHDWTDYMTAKNLGVSRSIISSIRTGRTDSLEDDLAIKFADLLELDRLDVVAIMHIERSKSPVVAKFWKDILSEEGLSNTGINTSINSLTRTKISNIESSGFASQGRLNLVSL